MVEVTQTDATADDAALVEGPGWSSGKGWGQGGRYPLRVELWLLRQTARLVPGVISTTPVARQYALHSLVASEVEQRKLDGDQARDLLCRAEVVLAVAHAAHASHVPGVRAAHGSAKIKKLLDGGLDLAAAAKPGKGQYSENRWGFFGGAYRGPEIQLGLIQAVGRDDPPLPGERCDAAAVRSGLGQILNIARQPVITATDATALADRLCVCRAGQFEDGRWLAELLCGDDPDGSWRRDTIRLLSFVCEHRRVTAMDYTDDVDTSAVNLLAFGGLAAEAERAGLSIAGHWRGTIFRFLAVWAWRRLWARMVNHADGSPMTIDDLVEGLADAMPRGLSVERFRASLLATTAGGLAVPAEREVHDSDFSEELADLAELMLLARRASELTGTTLDAYVGEDRARYEEFGPLWLAARLDEGARLALPDFARDLAHRLVNRAKRVAMDKARVCHDGSLSMNSKFHVTDGVVQLVQEESGSALGLRLGPLASVLAGCGVFVRKNDVWRTAEDWRQRLA